MAIGRGSTCRRERKPVSNFDCAPVTLKRAKYAARDTSQGVDRRVIGMDANEYTCPFCYGDDLLDKSCVVVPQFVLCVFTTVGKGFVELLSDPPSDLVGIVDVKCSCCSSAANLLPVGVPDSVAHMGIGRIMNTRCA